VDGEVFVDAGTAWDVSAELPDARIRGGAGFGLRLFLPIVEVARFEVAFDPSGGARVYLSEGNII
jgi:outer membrane translocation and assembly module TamA